MFRATIKKDAVFIDASVDHPVEVLNAAGGKLFHKNAADVDSGDTELATGVVVTITEGTWFVSPTSAEAVVREIKVANVASINSAGDATIGGNLALTGKATVTGDAKFNGKVGFYGTAPVARPDKKPVAEITAKEIGEALVTLGLIE